MSVLSLEHCIGANLLAGNGPLNTLGSSVVVQWASQSQPSEPVVNQGYLHKDTGGTLT
jgi:hypothetical protein